MFTQEPRTTWPRTIAILVLGYAVYYVLRLKHWNRVASLVEVAFVVWLLLPYRSFLPYGLRKITGEGDRQ